MEGNPFLDSLGSHAVVAEVIEDIISRGASVLYDHYLESKTESYAVARAMDDMFALVDWGLLPHETQEDVAKSNWTCEEEPTPPEIDTWARGAVPTKKRQTKAKAPGMPPVEQSTPSSPTAAAAAGAAANNAQSEPDPLASTTSQLDIPTRPLSPQEPEPVRPPAVDPAQAVRIKGLAQLKRDAELRARRKKAEEDLLANRKAKDDRIVRDTRGRQFTYDASGDVIIVARPSDKTLAPEFLESGVTIDNGVAEAQPVQRRTQGASTTLQKNKKKRPVDPSAQFAASLTRTPENAFIPAGTTQPPLKETMKLQPGVRVKDESISLSHLRAEEVSALACLWLYGCHR